LCSCGCKFGSATVKKMGENRETVRKCGVNDGKSSEEIACGAVVYLECFGWFQCKTLAK